MPEIQGRHRKAADAWAEKHRPSRGQASSARIDGYAQALADVEDANGYDLTACRAAYAHVCEAVTPGVGPGGAAAVAICVQLLRRRAERAEAERDRLRGALEVCERICHAWPLWATHPHRDTVCALLRDTGDAPQSDTLDAAAQRSGYGSFKEALLGDGSPSCVHGRLGGAFCPDCGPNTGEP